MSSAALIAAGLLLVLLASFDFLRTTISLSGTGFISRALAGGLWRAGSTAVAGLERRAGLSLRTMLGPSILIAVAGNWVAMHLCGYVLILRGGFSLVHGETGRAATWVETVAFAGSTLSTLGSSTVEVTGAGWDILSMIVATHGMILLTLSVSFFLNVLQTVNSARSFATRFHAQKACGPDEEAAERLQELGPDLTSVVVKLTASPLPRFFVPDDPTMDFPGAVVELGELVERGVLAEPSELVAALRLLGRHLGPPHAADDLAAARRWATHHRIDREDGE